MGLTPGSRLGPYEILAPLGVGGMGEVYRARDTNLGRDAAIKVLPDAFSNDAERLARFEREARALAALNHPNIASIYGLERKAGLQALAMELVEGPTLAETIGGSSGNTGGRALQLEEALAIARQIANALEAAHEQGIVHRDLKPANVKVRADGTVKVLDFGLAKVVEAAHVTSGSMTQSPTLTTPAMTQAGVILGTAAYMSPEQARGKAVDKRADIWAFGAVLYEMLTGRRPFAGETISDTLANILRSEPDWALVPARIRPLLQACLDKDPARRLRDIGDVWRLTEENEPVATTANRAPWILAAALIVVLAVVAWAPWRRAPVPPAVAHLQLALPDGLTLSAASPFAISPDGRTLVFLASGPDNVSRLWLRPLDSLQARPLPGTETAPTTPAPFWSPDGRFIAFTADGKLKRVDVNDGTVQVVCDLPQVAPGGSWNSKGVIILPQARLGIMQVPASGGTLKPVTEVDPSRKEVTHNNPRFLPDGRHFLYLRSSTDRQTIGIYVGVLDANPKDQSLERVVSTTLSADFAPSGTSTLGHLLFRREASLLAQPFDHVGMRLTGEPVVVAEQLSSFFSGGLFSVSDNGVLVYRAGAAGSSNLVLLDRRGQRLGTPGEQGAYSNVALSPDGTRAVVRRTDYGASDLNLWLLDLTSGATRRLTRERVSSTDPVWSPDGNTVAYAAVGSNGLYRLPVNGGAPEEFLLDAEHDDPSPLSWSGDGRFLLYTARGVKTGDDLWVLPLTDGRRAIPFARSEWNEIGGDFSPDSRWIAYVSDDSERREVYVRAFSPEGNSAGVGDIVTVSRGGGTQPRWRSDGKELFYLGPNGAMMSVDIIPGPTFRTTSPKVLFRLPQGTAVSDTGPDGRTLAVVPIESAAQAPFNVVLNWDVGLER